RRSSSARPNTKRLCCSTSRKSLVSTPFRARRLHSGPPGKTVGAELPGAFQGEENAMPRALKTLILTSAIALVLAPIQARADGFVTPWVGAAFGSSIDNGRGTFGVSAGGM